MAEGLYIERHKTAQADSFTSLRRAGIELAQQFCGELWTDFNLHDPGVTILEQLAYAITELIYRADFSVADLLSREDGIDYNRQALYAPELIFPCRPTTQLDYRKAMLNDLSELDNCWFQPLERADRTDHGYQGLYRILLKPNQTLQEERQRQDLIGKVRRWYHRHRNLCEDLAEVSCVQEVDYELCAHIEVSSAQRPVDILAGIYFNCARRIAGSVRVKDYHQAASEGQRLEEIFSGPFTDKGLLIDKELVSECDEFQISSLHAVINRIAGVQQIATLHLERQGEAYYDTVTCNIAETTLNLRIPQDTTEIRVVLTTNGRILPVDWEELRIKLEKLNFSYYSTRSTPQQLALLYTLPQGSLRLLSEYFSIQDQFPTIYGIGRFGVPESAAPEIKGRAKQLKSYLLIFEQIMANFLANLDAIPSLFSIAKEHRNSYSYLVLNNRQIMGLDALYMENPGATLGRIVADFDDYHARKNRLLDYLLALYGESFSQHSLRNFNDYYHPQEVEERIIDNKIEYLKAVVELGRDRAAAGDLGGDTWHARTASGLQRRVAMLLGFNQVGSRLLVMGLMQAGLKLVPHETYKDLKAGSDELAFIAFEQQEGEGQAKLLTVPLWEDANALTPNELRAHIGDAIPLKNSLLSERLLRQGIYLNRYRLLSNEPGDAFQLCFQLNQGQYWSLGCYAERESAIHAANALRCLLIHLNSEAEGLHLIEHILLRPTDCAEHEDLSLPDGASFYPFRASVVFPGWTARCHDPQFRLLAEETVRLNAPAHLFIEFYWLEFQAMHEFESLYEKWLNKKSEAQADATQLNQLASDLIRFLLEIGNREGDSSL